MRRLTTAFRVLALSLRSASPGFAAFVAVCLHSEIARPFAMSITCLVVLGVCLSGWIVSLLLDLRNRGPDGACNIKQWAKSRQIKNKKRAK